MVSDPEERLAVAEAALEEARYNLRAATHVSELTREAIARSRAEGSVGPIAIQGEFEGRQFSIFLDNITTDEREE